MAPCKCTFLLEWNKDTRLPLESTIGIDLDDPTSHKVSHIVLMVPFDIFSLRTRPLTFFVHCNHLSTGQEPNVRKDVYMGGSAGGIHCLFRSRIHHRVRSLILAPRGYVQFVKQIGLTNDEFAAWNAGCVLWIFWAGTGCLIQCINAIIWRDNTVNWAPVWCDIGTFLLSFVALSHP